MAYAKWKAVRQQLDQGLRQVEDARKALEKLIPGFVETRSKP